MSLSGLVLAAGQGRRFGSDKLAHLMPDQRPLLAHALTPLLAHCEQCVVVMRPDQLTLAAQIRQMGAQVVFCTDADGGMAHTLRAGLQAISTDSNILLMLGDLPYVHTDTVQRVAYAVRSGASLAAPFYAGKRGHPVGFASRWRTLLLNLHGDAGARQILRANEHLLEKVQCNDAGIHRDIDFPSDLHYATADSTARQTNGSAC